MAFGIFLIQFVIYGMAITVKTAAVDDSKLNTTENSGRSGRTYDGSQQFVSIPLGYYKPADESSATSIETEDNSTPNYNVPTSFDDFIPSSDKISRNSYPAFYKGKSGYYKNPLPSWKGDSGSGSPSPTWTFPSPADMAMMITLMKDMNDDKTPDITDGITGFLSKLTSDPGPLIAAVLLPAAILLAASIPSLMSLFTNAVSGSPVPIVTTTATGNNGRKLADNPSFVRPILEVIENFNARSTSDHTCLQKSFCDATRSGNHTDFRPIQKSIYKAFTFVDDYWLEALGVKQLMEALGTGNCDNIQCHNTPKVKETNFNKKRD